MTYDEGQVRVAIFGSWFMINGSWLFFAHLSSHSFNY